MENEKQLATQKKGVVTVVDDHGNETMLTAQIIRDYFCQNASNTEVAEFMALCRIHNLNPFLKEAYIVKYGASPAQMIVSKDAFLKRANRDADYEGFEAGVSVVNASGDIKDLVGGLVPPQFTLLGGWATVYRKGRKPLTERVAFSEYNTGKSTWAQKPATMIRKVAIVHALREAFPDNLGGMYIKEEMESGAASPSNTASVLEAKIMENAQKANGANAAQEQEHVEAQPAEQEPVNEDSQEEVKE